MKEKIYTGVICSAVTSLIINDFNLTSIEAIAVFLGSFVAIVFAPMIVASSPIMFKSRLNYSLFQNLCLIISFVILAFSMSSALLAQSSILSNTVVSQSVSKESKSAIKSFKSKSSAPVIFTIA